MRPRITLFLAAVLLASEAASAVQFAFTVDPDDRGACPSRNCIHRFDTTTGTSDILYEAEPWLHRIATAPDGSIYFATYAGGQFRIRRVAPTVVGGGIVFGDETIVYETTMVAGSAIDAYGDLAVRSLGDPPANRIYYSNASGAGADGQIYYLSAASVFEPYYTASLAALLVPSCGSTIGGYWAGDFAFGAGDLMYLASGNHCPAVIYLQSSAGADSVSGGALTTVAERPNSVVGLDFDSESRVLYYTDRGSTIRGYHVDTGVEDMFTVPGVDEIEDIVLLRTAPGLHGMAPRRVPGRAMFRLPDLSVAGIKTGTPDVSAGKRSLKLPARVTVRNDGMGVTTAFKIALSRGTTLLAFSVPGQADGRFGWVKGIPAGDEVVVAGYLTLKGGVLAMPGGSMLELTASVDSCQGDKGKPKHCRVREQDESNNTTTVSVRLPGDGGVGRPSP